MTPQYFFSKYDGKTIDYDGAYSGQCMDVMNQFRLDVHNDSSNQLRAATAYQSWLKGGQDYDKIHYQPGCTPQEGDIVYWSDQYIKGTGHVAIATNKANQSVFTSFDQNWPVGSKCHYQEHTYSGVVGWLRNKSQQQNNQDQPIKKRMKITNGYRLVFVRDNTEDQPEYWIIKKNQEEPFETRHKVIDNKMEVVPFFGSIGAYSEMKRSDLKGLTAGNDFNWEEFVKTKPTQFLMVE
jgi:hypothetical protein